MATKSAFAKTANGLIGFANGAGTGVVIWINVIGIMIAILEIEKDSAIAIPQIVTTLAHVLIA